MYDYICLCVQHHIYYTNTPNIKERGPSPPCLFHPAMELLEAVEFLLLVEQNRASAIGRFPSRACCAPQIAVFTSWRIKQISIEGRKVCKCFQVCLGSGVLLEGGFSDLLVFAGSHFTCPWEGCCISHRVVSGNTLHQDGGSEWKLVGRKRNALSSPENNPLLPSLSMAGDSPFFAKRNPSVFRNREPLIVDLCPQCSWEVPESSNQHPDTPALKGCKAGTHFPPKTPMPFLSPIH